MREFPYYSPARILAALRDRGGAPLKRLGQNFLVDPNQVRRIAAEILERTRPGELLLEIGPGPGALTHALLTADRRVRAVEIDPVLASMLADWSEGAAGLEIIEGDARAVLEAGAEQGGGGIQVLYGNLPYYITTELLLAALAWPGLRAAVFLVQNEFALRLAGGSISSLAVFAGNLCTVHVPLHIPPGAFFPAPAVRSSLLVLTPHAEGPLCPPAILERLLRATYQGKRKTVRNNWKHNAAAQGFAAEALFAAAERVGIDPSLRPEAITAELYFALVRELG